MRALLVGLLLLSGIAAAAQTPPTAVVSWGAVTTRLDGSSVGTVTYNVYQGSAGAEIKVANTASLTYTANGQSGTTLCFKVTAVDSNGLEGGFSNEACKSFPASPPAAPQITVN